MMSSGTGVEAYMALGPCTSQIDSVQVLCSSLCLEISR